MGHRANLFRERAAACIMAVSLISSAGQLRAASIFTYHSDNQRTGWNQTEAVLTPQNVAQQFASIATVYLDSQVNAQPLVLTNQQISGYSGTYQVVYVVTEGNTVYAINAVNGAILLRRSVGMPVPCPTVACGNTGPTIGIDSTPVINPVLQTLNLISYTVEDGTPTYKLHALKLVDLTDALPPVTITASHNLSNGKQSVFAAQYERQRPALLYANGNIYAGFGSFGDFYSQYSRGWFLGWNANTLAPLPMNEEMNRLATSPDNYFLSTIWMSGAGPAADGTGNIYFSTGNSDPSGTTYDGVYNIQESVVKMQPTLNGVSSLFTPSNVGDLDVYDLDVSAGGVLAVPTQAASSPQLIVASAKDGRMFVLNASNLGGYTNGGPDNVITDPNVGRCWCAPAYFMGSDGIGRIVSGGGNQVSTWKIIQTSSSTKIVQEAAGQMPVSIQSPGVFPVVSSNGTQAGTGIIWAVQRPIDTSRLLTLYAFSATPSNGVLPLIGHYPVGFWPKNIYSNANGFPVVANGQVYVTSNQQLMIFGLAPQTQGVPDLVVSSVSYSPTTGTFTSVVKNQGSGPTPPGVPIGVAYWVDGKKATWGVTYSPLATGASATIGTQGDAFTMPGGTHSIAAFVDDVNRMAESDKTNNVLWAPSSLESLPNVALMALSYSNETGEFTSQVLNQGQGATPSGVPTGVAYLVDGTKVSWGSTYQTMLPNSLLTIGTQGGAYHIPAGTHTITAIADDVDRFAVSSRSQNTFSRSITITDPK